MVLAVLLCATLPASGEILIDNFQSGNIQRYDNAGNLLQTYTGSGGLWTGASLTPQGFIATARRSPTAGVDILNPNGTQFLTFDTPAVNVPGDISVFADGTMAIGSQLSSTIEFYSSTGIHLRSVSGPNQPYGSTIAPDGTLWVGGVGGVGFGFKHYKEDGTLLGSFSTSFMPGDVVADPHDGTLWVTEREDSAVAHLDASGTLLNSFSVDFSFAFDGIAMAPDQTLYLVDQTDPRVLHYSEAGSLLDSFTMTSSDGPVFITVIPEPTTFSFGILCSALLIRPALRRMATVRR
jgi:DNA-binding beta-propeller fold protein YncE